MVITYHDYNVYKIFPLDYVISVLDCTVHSHSLGQEGFKTVSVGDGPQMANQPPVLHLREPLQCLLLFKSHSFTKIVGCKMTSHFSGEAI